MTAKFISDKHEILIMAVKANNVSFVKDALMAGADVYGQDNNGKNALDYAKEINNPMIIDLLTSASHT